MSRPNSDRILLVIAHGSRAKAANEEFQNMVSNLRQRNMPYTQVDGVFLELAQPTLAERAIFHYQQGARYFDVYPLFFNNGKHVGKDLPALVADLIERLPDAKVTLLEYFGASEQLLAAVCADINQQVQ